MGCCGPIYHKKREEKKLEGQDTQHSAHEDDEHAGHGMGCGGGMTYVWLIMLAVLLLTLLFR